MPIRFEEEEALIRFWEEGESSHLDVRELLEAGGEPYSHIMHCVRQVGVGDTLNIHALFEPKPLLRQLERMGLQVECRRRGLDHWVVVVQEGAGRLG